jgi:hypothetical protein
VAHSADGTAKVAEATDENEEKKESLALVFRGALLDGARLGQQNARRVFLNSSARRTLFFLFIEGGAGQGQ